MVSDASASEATKEMAAEAIEAADKMASEMAEATEDMASKAAEKMDDMHDKMGMEDAVATSPMEPDMDPIEGLRAHILDFSAKPEHTDPVVKVQHLLVSFAGTRTSATRSREEAEQLAGELFARIQKGEDFDALVKQYTDDSHPGIYTMTLGSPAAGQHSRYGMVPAFGNAGWRLAVDEIGVAGFDSSASPFGWHIVKRVAE